MIIRPLSELQPENQAVIQSKLLNANFFFFILGQNQFSQQFWAWNLKIRRLKWKIINLPWNSQKLFKETFSFSFWVRYLISLKKWGLQSNISSVQLWDAKEPNPAWHPTSVSGPLSVTFRCIKMLALVDLGGETAVKYLVITQWMWWGIVIQANHTTEINRRENKKGERYKEFV